MSFKSIDEVPELFRHLVIESDDGLFQPIPQESLKTVADVDALKTVATKERHAHNELQKKYNELLKQHQDKPVQGNTEANTGISEARLKQLEAELADKTKSLNEMQSNQRLSTINSAIEKSARQRNVIDNSIPDLQLILGSGEYEILENGSIITKDGETLDSVIDNALKTRSHWVQGETRGIGGNPSTGKSGPDFSKMTLTEKALFVKDNPEFLDQI